MVELPTIRPGRSRLRSWHLDALLGLLGPIPMFVVGLRAALASSGEPWVAWVLLPAAGASAVLAFVKGWRARGTELKFEPPTEPAPLVDWARQLRAQLEREMATADWDSAELRITVHKVERKAWNSEPTSFQQLTNYVGGRQTGMGRRFPARAGIIGVAARHGSPVVSQRVSEDDALFTEEMVKNWGYTWDEANGLSADRRSWMAVPMTDEARGRVVGVVYLDSRLSNLADSVQEAVIRQVEELVRIVRERYSK